MKKKKELDERAKRQKIASLEKQSQDEKIHAELNVAKPKSTSILAKRPSQKSILGSGVVVKKAKPNDPDESTVNGNGIANKNKVSDNERSCNDETSTTSSNVEFPSAYKVVGILPGIGNYDSDESSSDCEDAGAFDFLAIKLKKTEECD